MNKINIAIVDDEELIVELLYSYFQNTENINVGITAFSGDVLLKKLSLAKELPQLILLDLRMKQMNGMETIAVLKKEFPEIKTIIMSTYYKKNLMGYMLKSGVNAFIPKGISLEKLINIIHEVIEKDYFFMEEQIEVLRKQLAPKIPQPVLNECEELTDREKEVLSLICKQKTAKEISELIHISKRTVEGHRTNLLIKTGAKNSAGLVIYAVQNKIIDPSKELFL